MGKTLIVYYSRTGNTRQIAAAIAAQLNADIEPIQDGRRRTGLWGYFRSAREAMQHRVIGLAGTTKNPADYDLVVLGTPVWAHNMCSPMRSYIAANRHYFKEIAVFCAQGGSGGSAVAAQVAELCGRRARATLILNEDDIKKERFAVQIDGFVQSLARSAAAPMPLPPRILDKSI
jgi:flavodoxin